jgi:hypothetical protein
MHIRYHSIIKRIAQKRRLTYASTTSNDDKLRFFGRDIPPSAEHFDLFLTPKELHFSPPFENDSFENRRF